MKTNPTPAPAALQADPKIVKKTRRDRAAYAPCGGLFGKQDNDYKHQPNRSLQPPRMLEFWRPSL
jgi:hypothetical protein